MKFLEELAEKALNDSYLKILVYKAEVFYGTLFIDSTEEYALSEKEYDDLLRFADILSRSQQPKARNLSFKIISLLYDYYSESQDFQIYSTSILTKLGNFPSLKLIGNQIETQLNDEIAIDTIIKNTIQAAPSSESTFTDAQYTIFEKMKDSNHFSFSGPTSFGKSFIFESFIKYIMSIDLTQLGTTSQF